VVLLGHLLVFSASAVTLTMQVSGSGTTDPTPGAHSYSIGTTVTMWALPADGWRFDHWENGVTGKLNPSSITLALSNKTVKAVFTQLPAFSADTALKYFVDKVDRNYSWNNYKTVNKLGYSTYFIDMNSQQWRTAAEVNRPIWQHYQIIHKGWFTGDTCVYLIDGGGNGGTPPGEIDEDIGLMSLLTGLPIVDMKQVPNEPLTFSDEGFSRNEDEILAYSLDKFLNTGDYNWPVHQAMVKAAVRGMDTVQRKFSGINKFIVVGASKRGWTTWLTAAYDDPRIIAFVPIVIDILSIDQQMDHHWDTYGFYAPAVQPYADFDLFCRMKTNPLGAACLQIIDPFAYLNETSAYNKPKLIAGASGDQFFLPDAMKYYYNSIPGMKHVRYMPNTDHSMEPSGAFDSLLTSAMAWAGNVKNGNANPVYSWTIGANNTITLTTGSTPSSVTLWQATNPNARDFRYESIGAAWTSTALPNQGNNTYVGYCPPPAQGWTAFFVEVNFGSDHIYSSQIVVNPDVEPFDGTHCL
jgi:PhoPQ-activated pathogenicity-related protein